MKPLTPEQRDALRYWHRLAAEVRQARESGRGTAKKKMTKPRRVKAVGFA